MEAVRVATAADGDRFSELADEFLTAMHGQRGASLASDPGWVDPGADVRLGRLSDLLADPGHLAVVGTLDDVVMGFAVGHLERGDGQGRRGVLDACYVEAGARGVGLGSALITEALAWMRQQGCDGVDGVALPGDRTAKAFFETAGFKARMLTMYRPLP